VVNTLLRHTALGAAASFAGEVLASTRKAKDEAADEAR